MNINNITYTKSVTIAGSHVRKACDELVDLQNTTSQKYVSFYTSIKNNPDLCKKFLFINSVFNLALRESSNFKQTEYLYNLLADAVSECSKYNPGSLSIVDNDLWSHCILINTHTHDNQFLRAIRNTLALPIRLILDRISETTSYLSLSQHLSGADSDISLTKPYELFLKQIIPYAPNEPREYRERSSQLMGLDEIHVDKNEVLEELTQIRSLITSSLPSKNIYYILKFYLAVACNHWVKVNIALPVNQYARICRDLVSDFLHSRKPIDEEKILLVLDIHRTHKIIALNSQALTDGLPNEGQWEYVDYQIFNEVMILIEQNKFTTCKDQAFLKLVDSCIRASVRADTNWLVELSKLIMKGFITDPEPQCYFLEALKHFHPKELERKLLFEGLIQAIGQTITNPRVITLLHKILEEHGSERLQALFRTAVGPLLNKWIKAYSEGANNLLLDKMKLKDLVAALGGKAWKLINKKLLDKKMLAEKLSLSEVAGIVRNIHISTKPEKIKPVIKQLKLFNNPLNPEKLQEENELLWEVLHSHAFYSRQVTPFPMVRAYRKAMQERFPALIHVKASYIFDGNSKIIFVSDDNQFKYLSSLRPGNKNFNFNGLTMIDLADPEGRYSPLPINSQTIKTFPQWVINLYTHELPSNKEVMPNWMVKVALPYIFTKYKEVIATLESPSKSDELTSELTQCIENLQAYNEEFVAGLSCIIQDTRASFSQPLKEVIKSLDNTLAVLRMEGKKEVHMTVYKEFANQLFVNEEYREINKNSGLIAGIEASKKFQLYLVGLMAGMLSGVNGFGEERDGILFLRFLSGFIMGNFEDILKIANSNCYNDNIATQLLKTDSCSNSIISPLLGIPLTKRVIDEDAHEAFIV